MSYLKINNLSYKYLHTDVLSNINLEFQNTWSGIVGQNGCGKTTLLKLISKKLELQDGSIIGNNLVYYCEQKLELEPQGFDDFRDDYSSKRYKLQELLDIDNEWFYRWKTLSFGEKKRIQIAIALFMDVDVLLLDEPTNHLDISTKKRVIEALKSFKKVGLIVSHERDVLDALCDNTIIIKHNSFYKYKTNYSNAILEFKKDLESLSKEAEKQNRKVKKLLKDIQSQKEKVALSSARFSKKNIDKKDSSTKEKINLAKLTGKDKSESKKVDTLNSKLTQQKSKKISLDKEYKKGIVLENSILKNTIFPIILKSSQFRVGEKIILTYPDIIVNSEDKIAIVGDNGVGKTSFIKHLLSKIDQKDILYLPQEIDENRLKELFKSINELNDKRRGELFTFITRLSSNPKVLLDNNSPSPGELRKLLIAKAMLEHISLIVLDEPTNHMDIDSIISLEEALKNYSGTVIFVSHDKIFVENIANKIWKIEDFMLKV